MANESTYALISSLLPDIWEAALMFAKENFFMPSLVTVYTDQSGMQDRKITEYAAGSVSINLGETDDLDSERQALSRSLLSTLTPTEIGAQHLITDRRMDSDDVMNVMADAVEIMGYAVGQQVEQDLVGNFSSFTAGTIDNTAGTLTWRNIYDARRILAAAPVPGRYSLVLHEHQWSDLANEANIVGISNPGPLQIRDEIQSNYYIGSLGDVDIFVTGNAVLSAGTAVYGGMFNRQAIAYDIRRAFRIEADRKPNLRATALNYSMIYAQGTWRPSYGVAIISDASAPS